MYIFVPFSHLIHHWFNFWPGGKFAFVITMFTVYGQISTIYPPLLNALFLKGVWRLLSQWQKLKLVLLHSWRNPFYLLDFRLSLEALMQHSNTASYWLMHHQGLPSILNIFLCIQFSASFWQNVICLKSIFAVFFFNFPLYSLHLYFVL